MSPASSPHSVRIAVFLQLETEHGRGVLRGIARFFRQHPEVSVLKYGRQEASHLELRRLRPDGIIAKVASAEDERFLSAVKVPVVNVSGQRPTARIPTVNSDDVVVGRIAARHLLSRGYRHLAFCGLSDHLASRRRASGFVTEARERGIFKIARTLLRGSQFDQMDAATQKGLLAWLRGLPKPIGIFGFTDPLAIAVAEACESAGLKVPEEVAILGVGNDLTRLDFAHVDVSSIQLNTGMIGEIAATHLWRCLREKEPIPRETVLPPVKVVTRRSTDLFAVDDEAVAAALEHIQANVGNPTYVIDIAKVAGVSRRVLEMKFRRLLKTSIYSEVQRVHFEHSIELMAEPGMTISEIAYGSGFESAQRFSTAFARRYGKAPSEHRRSLRGGRSSPVI